MLQDPDVYINQQISELRNFGCHISLINNDILQDLRGLAEKAFSCGKDELANEILQLVVAEKLRGNK